MSSIANVVAAMAEAKETVREINQNLLPVVLWKMEKEGALGCVESAEMLKDAVMDISSVVKNITGEDLVAPVPSLKQTLASLGGSLEGWVAITVDAPHLLMRREKTLAELAGWLDCMDETARNKMVVFKV